MNNTSVTCKRISLALIILLGAICSFGQPVISSFSPASGPVGSSVTITGSNFNTTPANNIVYFGAVKANVTAATATSLTVTVPAGATYKPITVTISGSTAYSSRPFLTTFTGGGQISSSSFGIRQDFTTDIRPNAIALSDFDGDGKIDVATANNHSNAGLASVSILRNTSSAGTISFAPKQDIVTGGVTYCIASADIDGDGKYDIISGSIASSNISVFRNTSTIGNISFAPKIDFAVTGAPYDIAAGDIDGDGKTDVAIVDNGITFQGMSVFRNTGSIGAISFAPKVDFTTLLSPKSIVCTDMDDDGKADIGFTNENSNSFSIYRNTSSSGAVSFASRIDYPCGSGNQPYSIASGDIDNDAKTDLIVVINNSSGGGAQLFRNTGSIGTISYTFNTSILSGSSSNTCYHAGVNDINGDGKIDISLTVAGSSSGQSQVYQNNTTSGTFSFSSATNFFGSFAPYAIVFGDLEGDGKPELVVSEFTGDKISVYKNQSGVLVAPLVSSFTPTSGSTNTSVTINGANFTGVTSVKFGGVSASTFGVVNSNTITATVGAGASGSVEVTNAAGSGSLPGFIFIAPPTISSFSPTSSVAGGTVTITGTNFIVPISVEFGGVAASSVSYINSTTITAVVATGGASGNVTVTTTGGTASMPGFTFLTATITSFNPTSGGPGTVVTINGSNFNLVSGVSFGGVSATSYSPVSSTLVTATVGNGASGNVTVSTLNNGVGSAPGFIYTGPIISSFNPTSGNTGTVVTITGQNFTGATAVSFGGVQASSFTIINATTITATVASGSSGNVTVTTPVATASLVGFTYTGPPVINSFAPVSTGAGGVVTISGNHFTGATAVSFGGVAAQSFTVVNPTTITAIVNATGATGNVSVTTPNGTTSLAGFTFVSAPRITSFSPTLGPAGTIVTITGQGFSSSPANNAVFFGPVRASISAASSTSLTVTVPPGTVYKPISVTVNGFTAYSKRPFVLTFANNGITAFSSSSFAPRVSFTVNTGLKHSVLGDFDNDGMADIAVVNQNQLGFSVLKNTSSSGNLSFVAPVHFSTGFQNYGINIADIDGDGKQDVLSGTGSAAVSVFRNTSSGSGLVSFATKVDIPAGSGPFYIDTDDIDGDGRTDIITANSFGNSISILRNTSGVGTITFAAKIDISLSGDPQKITVRDLDGDDKPDIIVSTSNPSQVLVFRNTSSPGLVTFAPALNFVTGQVPEGLIAADFDGDDKPDIITTNYLSANATIFRNTSVTGSISFTSFTFNSNVGSPHYITAGDINGDGKIDIAVNNESFISVFENTSASGSISFNSKFEYLMQGCTNVNIGDLDNDGKPDLTSQLNSSGTFVSVLRNTVGSFGIASFAPVSGAAGTVITITGVNFSLATAVSFGGTPCTSFTVVNPTTITAVVGTGASGNVSVTTPGGTASLSGFTYLATPTITSFTPASGVNGATVTITGTNFTGATAVSFGGTPAISFTVVNATTITAVVSTGASGSVSVTTPGGTGTLAGFTFIGGPAITSFVPSSAGTGTTITITGSNFTGATAVSFGGTAASSFAVVNATTITAVVSTGASGNVSVTTPGGTTALAGFTFVPAPGIASFTPLSGAVGATVTITGSNFTGTTAVSFGGTTASSFNVVNSTTITAVVGAGTSGNVSVTTPGGTVTLAGFTFISGPGISSFTPLSGATGATITITGSNFTGATVVSFGGTPAASFTVVNATTITAEIGAGASGSVSVTTPGGTVSLPGFTFDVVTSVGGANNNSIELLVSPNPARNNIVVKHPAALKTSHLKLIDIDGRTVKLLVIARSTTQTSFSVKGLGSGIYKLIWTDDKRMLTRTLLITQ